MVHGCASTRSTCASYATAFLQASFDCCMPTQKVPDEKLYSIVAIVMPSCSRKEHFTHSSSSFFCVVANQWTAWAIHIVVLLWVNTIRKTTDTTYNNGKPLPLLMHVSSFNISETGVFHYIKFVAPCIGLVVTVVRHPLHIMVHWKSLSISWQEEIVLY